MDKIHSEKKQVIDAIRAGHNVFVTGNAGTGKSYLLRLIKKKFANRGLHLTASTGIAAVNIGGVTLHSWAGIGTGNASLHEILRYIGSAKCTKLRRKLRTAKLLAIDEISMISINVLDLLNDLLKTLRANQKPFGGLQVIFIGDFLQLPPINNINFERKFCFESKAWKEANLKTFILNKIFRQSDERLVKLLHNLRIGNITASDLEILMSRMISSRDSLSSPTIIATHNKQVEEINIMHLDKIPMKSILFHMEGEGEKKKLEFLKKNCLAPQTLELKIGAQVMMLKNTLQKLGIINGSIGIIKAFSPKGLPIVEFNNGQIHTIEKEEWSIEEFDQLKQKLVKRAKILQVPLMLAWAITVHKSQGMTLDSIECDLGNAFEEGQIYVALSRVKDLNSLYIKSFRPELIKTNNKVINFYKNAEKALVD